MNPKFPYFASMLSRSHFLSKSRNILLQGSMVIMLLLVSNCGKKEKSGAKAAAPKSQSVQVLVADTSSLNNAISATGTVLANEEVEIRAEVQGRVTGIYFREGENVATGKLLLKIDDRELQSQLKKTDIEIQLATDHEARNKKLLEANGISKDEYDISLNNLSQLQAEKELIETQIAKTSIYAPFSGTIGLRYISEGAYVSSANIITTLHQIDPVKVEFSIPEKYAAQLANGAAIHFTVEGDTRQYEAKVYAKEPNIDPATRTIKLRALSENSNHALTPGAFAKLNITIGTIRGTIVLPSETIIPGIAGQSVMTIKNGKATLQKVEIGIRTENNTQIKSGIMPGDTVIMTGLLSVKDGMPVKGILQNK